MTAAEFRAWIGGLAEVEATIPARVVLDRLPDGEVTPPESRVSARQEPDELLTVKQAAARLGVNSRWLYRNSSKLPFTKKLSSGTLRFSAKAMERWLKARTA